MTRLDGTPAFGAERAMKKREKLACECVCCTSQSFVYFGFNTGCRVTK